MTSHGKPSTSLISVNDFLPKVRRLQKLDLGALHQVADVVDVLGLQAVRRADRQLKVINRTQQNRVDFVSRFGCRRLRLHLPGRRTPPSCCCRIVAARRIASSGSKVPLVSRSIIKLVEVSALLDPRRIHDVADCDGPVRTMRLAAAARSNASRHRGPSRAVRGRVTATAQHHQRGWPSGGWSPVTRANDVLGVGDLHMSWSAWMSAAVTDAGTLTQTASAPLRNPYRNQRRAPRP